VELIRLGNTIYFSVSEQGEGGWGGHIPGYRVGAREYIILTADTQFIFLIFLVGAYKKDIAVCNIYPNRRAVDTLAV